MIKTSRTKSTYRSEQGGVVTEFAIVLPILILLIQGVASFGLGYREYGTVADAVRVAARSAAAQRGSGSPCSTAEDTFRKSVNDYGIDPAAYTLKFEKYRKTIDATSSDEWFFVFTAERSSGTLMGLIAEWTFSRRVRAVYMFEEESQNLNACMNELAIL